MREIKFRVWDKTNKCFALEDSFVIGNNGTVYLWKSDNSLTCIKKFEINQFTGLLDKQGVKIYEGDILRADRLDSENKEWLGVVKHNSYGGLCLYYNKYISNTDKTLQTPIQDPQNAIWIKQHCEVIGNIYENSELIKE